MIPANTICVSQEGPANALALNKDSSQVVIAGRNVFKVFSIGENDFSEVCNLRVGKNLNLNFSSIDVAWSAIEENTLATAATNGAVVVWNLGRSGRSKQEHVFSDHKRTVNKVSFHLTEPAQLISGSQDGMMKCFDLRMKEVARTFISNTESIRDVQFSPHQPHAFAAVSENGSVQLWDVRRHERCVAQHAAHSGPVFACDWHPELPWLATASRDKTIKVWDMQTKPNLEHTIYTIASVGHVKWRPQKKYQVASCALVLDCAVHVWDVRRPHVPLATFAEHRDVTTAIAWQGSPNTFLSTSRDCSLYRHRFREAAHPVLWANPQGVCLSARGELAHCLPRAPLPALPAPAPAAPRATHLGRKQPTAGSLSAAAQATLEAAFPTNAASILCRYGPAAGGPADPGPFVACAREYRMSGPPHEVAQHNAAVARKYNRHMVAHIWDVVLCIFKNRANAPRPAPPPPPAPRPPPPPPPAMSASVYSGSGVEEEPLEEVEEWPENQFHNNGVLGKPTHSIYIPPAKYSQRGDLEGAGWVSAASAHYVDVEAADWTLPEEAFPLRAAPAPPPRPASVSTGSGRTGSPPPAPPAPPPPPSPTATLMAHASEESGEETGSSLLVECGAWRGEAPRAARHVAAALRAHAAAGDVQTAAALLLPAPLRHELAPYIPESLQEQWLLGYIELLQRHKLWNVATEVIQLSWINSVWSISQQSTVVCVVCGRCGRRLKPRAACEHCPPRPRADSCAVCKQVVRGLYAWCQGCAHGGHLQHMRRWLRAHALCPAGCGHRCQPP